MKDPKYIVSSIFRYIEMAINIFSNALIQTFLVYTTVVLIYKLFIEDQTANYIPLFVSGTLNKIKNTFMELNFAINGVNHIFNDSLNAKYQRAIQDEIQIGAKNKAHNKKVIDRALMVAGAILVVFALFTYLSSRLSFNVKWYNLLLSATITVIGTSYEYFFITQIIIKYHYVELTKIYDTIINEFNNLSETVINDNLKSHLQSIVKKSNINNNNFSSGIDNLVKTTIGNINQNIKNITNTNDTNNTNIKLQNTRISNVIDSVANLPNVTNISTNTLIQKAGNTLNDIDHYIRNSST